MNNLLNRRGSTYISGGAPELYNKIVLLVPRPSTGILEESVGTAMMSAIRLLFDDTLYDSEGNVMYLPSGGGGIATLAPDVNKFTSSRKLTATRNKTASASGQVIQYPPTNWTLQDENYWYSVLSSTMHEPAYNRDRLVDGAVYKETVDGTPTFYSNCYEIINPMPDDSVLFLYYGNNGWQKYEPKVYYSTCDYNRYSGCYSARHDESTDLYYKDFWSDNLMPISYDKTKYCFINTSSLLAGIWHFYGSAFDKTSYVPYAKYIGDGDVTVKTGRLNGIFVSYLD